MLVRSGELTDTMSRYLIQRITENPAIELHYNTEITKAGRRHAPGARRMARQEDRRDLDVTPSGTFSSWRARRREPSGCRAASLWTTRASS